MKILEIVKIKEIAREREAYWIYYYLERGVYLTNIRRYSSKHKKILREGKNPFGLPPDKKIGMHFPKEAIDILVKRQRKERAKCFHGIIAEWTSPSAAQYQGTDMTIIGSSANSTWKHLATDNELMIFQYRNHCWVSFDYLKCITS